jgi:hypothetical protein
MTNITFDNKYADLAEELKISCEKCSGLCCVALYCMKTDGFPADKEGGKPCKHLMGDFRCDMHAKLAEKNMKGCLSYDCFGAGQKVTRIYGADKNWRLNPEKASEIFRVFLIVFQLHQMEWYLLESLSLDVDEQLKGDIKALINENESMTSKSPENILKLDIDQYQLRVNQVLKQVNCKAAAKAPGGKNFLGKNFNKANLDNMDFSMALMIAADLEGCSLRGTSFLGADMRDANIMNTDLSNSIFLTQMQINSAKGNLHTKLPENISRPASWQRSL